MRKREVWRVYDKGVGYRNSFSQVETSLFSCEGGAGR